MTGKQLAISRVLFGLCGLYFILFIFPNLTGARDITMLSLFELDEFAFYPHIMRMITAGDTLYQTVRNFLIYLMYFYGYPFFFFSAVVLLPIKWLAGAAFDTMTRFNVLLLRQMLSVLPMLASVVTIVYLQTRFRSWLRSLGLLALLLSLPGLFGNNIFWHPDSLAILFVMLTFFFLDRDDLRLGKNFYWAALACGMATSTKHQGLFFFAAIPLYILWSTAAKRVNWKRAALSAILFVIVMALAVVASNPLLLLPMERAEIIGVQQRNLAQLSEGFIMRVTEPYWQIGAYPDDFRIHYGEMAFIVLAVISLIAGLRQPKNRVLNALILAWAIPLAYTLNFTATRRTHYFLPLMIPVISGLANLFPRQGAPLPAFKNSPRWQNVLRPAISWLAAGIIVVQFVLFVRTDIGMFFTWMQREQTAPGIQFYEDLEQDYLSALPEEMPLTIYRDWHLYVPDRARWRVEIDWDLATYAMVTDIDPDLILLEQDYIAIFTAPDALENASDRDKMEAWQQFYNDAINNAVPGYQIVYQDHTGMALARSGLLPNQTQP